MLIIQTKHIPKIYETLVVKHDKCILQESHDELGLLDEYIIPILYNNNEFFDEIHIELDDILLDLMKEYECMVVHTTYVEFGLITYKFKCKQAEHFDTQLPQYVFMCSLPDFKFDCDVILRHSYIKLDNGLTYKLELIHEHNCIVHDIRVNGKFIEPGLCKVYKEENSIVCFEYIKNGYIKRRFISPIEV